MKLQLLALLGVASAAAAEVPRVSRTVEMLTRGLCNERGESDVCKQCDPMPSLGEENHKFCAWLFDKSASVEDEPSLYVYEAIDAADFHEQVQEILELVEAEAGTKALASKKGGEGGGEKKEEKKEKKEEKKEKKDEKKKKKEEDKKEKKEEKKKKKSKKKKDDDDDDYSSKSSKDYDDDDSTSFDSRSLEPVAYKGYIATRDMCFDPIGPNIQDVCDEIYDGLCSDPKSLSDEDFCDFAGFGDKSKKSKKKKKKKSKKNKSTSKSAKYAYQLRG